MKNAFSIQDIANELTELRQTVFSLREHGDEGMRQVQDHLGKAISILEGKLNSCNICERASCDHHDMDHKFETVFPSLVG